MAKQVGDPAFFVCYQAHKQWERDFGIAYVSKQPKGIAVVEVKP